MHDWSTYLDFLLPRPRSCIYTASFSCLFRELWTELTDKICKKYAKSCKETIETSKLRVMLATGDWWLYCTCAVNTSRWLTFSLIRPLFRFFSCLEYSFIAQYHYAISQWMLTKKRGPRRLPTLNVNELFFWLFCCGERFPSPQYRNERREKEAKKLNHFQINHCVRVCLFTSVREIRGENLMFKKEQYRLVTFLTIRWDINYNKSWNKNITNAINWLIWPEKSSSMDSVTSIIKIGVCLKNEKVISSDSNYS